MPEASALSAKSRLKFVPCISADHCLLLGTLGIYRYVYGSCLELVLLEFDILKQIIIVSTQSSCCRVRIDGWYTAPCLWPSE